MTTPARDTAPGYVFVVPKNGPGDAGPGQDGCVILNNEGQPVWLHLLRNEYLDAVNFEVQEEYKGRRVLTWWAGDHLVYGQDEYVTCDPSYREIKPVKAAHGYEGDHHEFLITPEDTALLPPTARCKETYLRWAVTWTARCCTVSSRR